MPSTQIEFDDRDKSFHWIVYVGHREKRFRVCHEAILGQLPSLLSIFHLSLCSCVDILRDSLQHAPRLQDKGWQDHSTQVCAGPQLRDDVGKHCIAQGSARASHHVDGVPHHCPDLVPPRLSRPLLHLIWSRQQSFCYLVTSVRIWLSGSLLALLWHLRNTYWPPKHGDGSSDRGQKGKPS